MSLLKKANMSNNNKKTKNKVGGVSSRPPFPRLELFLVIVIFIAVISPFVIRMIVKFNTERQIINIFVSLSFEVLFGAEIAESLISEFNEENPGIRARLSRQDEKKPDFQEPDIYIFDEENSSIIFELADLKPYITEEINIERLRDDSHQLSDNAILGIPLVSFMDVLFYNIDILKEAGFDRPPRTRGEYNTYANTVADNASKGFSIYSDDLSSVDNDELNKQQHLKIEDFAEGKAAMIIASTQAIPYLREKLGDDAFSITAIPFAIDGSAGKYDINLSGIYAGIASESANPEAAWKFLTFLIDKSHVFCELLKAVPGIPSNVIPAEYIQDDPFYSKAWDIFEYNRN